MAGKRVLYDGGGVKSMKVMMRPHLTELAGEGGINRVVENYFRFLPDFDIELVEPNATSFDIIAAHAGITGSECTVAHTHGLYFSADYPADEWEWHVNSRVIDACRNAKLITVPSSWVGEIFQRDMRLNPLVIPHGVVWEDWQHNEECGNFVLYNKTRNADACDNSVLDILLRKFPDITFVSTLPTPSLQRKTFNEWPANFKIIETGVRTPHKEMRKFVQQAGIYLSVAKETWGIGIVEAMASGTPILGWNHGGNSFLVQHGVNGYLAKPGDIDDLCEGLAYCVKHRGVLGANGREMAKQWTWAKACGLVAGVYRLAMKEENRPMVIESSLYGVSCGNLDKVELHQASA